MNRRAFLKSCSVAGGGILLSGLLGDYASAGSGQRPNVLWLVADDMCPDIGCYGNGLVHTPNLDRLAAEGTRFSRAFSTSPVCSASRSAFMTGMYQTTIGAHQHRPEQNKPLPGNVKVITDHFRAAGYFTANAGKEDMNFYSKDAFDGRDWTEAKPSQPFFARKNFGVTHREFRRDPDHPIDADDVKLPPYYPDHPILRRDWANYLESIGNFDKQVGKQLDRLEEAGVLDNTIVFLFADQGRAHFRGKQWLYDGGIHIPLIVRWPGHIKAGAVVDDPVSAIDLAPTALSLIGEEVPEHIQGKVILGPDAETREYVFAARDRCDETFDRIRCVRSKRFKYIRNFLPHLPYTQFNQYKYREYPAWTVMEVMYHEGKLNEAQSHFMGPIKPDEELYDLAKDPHEVNNLAGKAEYKAVLEKMREALNDWIKRTDDKGEDLEDRSKALKWWSEKHGPKYKRVMRQRGLSPRVTPREYLKYWEKRILGSEK